MANKVLLILLEKIRALGDVGEQVTVNAGYARNYLLPYNKAVRATKDNIAQFASRASELKRIAEEALQQAQERAAALSAASITIESRASNEGRLYGSVGILDLIEAFTQAGFMLKKSEIQLPNGPFRQTGEHEFLVSLHSDVELKLKVLIVAFNEVT